MKRFAAGRGKLITIEIDQQRAKQAKQHFETNLQFTKGKFLLTYIYYARFYAMKTLDEELFNELLAQIENTPVDILPGYQLLNAIAKQKAERLKIAGEHHELARRVHGFHAAFCPVARSIEGSIEIGTELELA